MSPQAPYANLLTHLAGITHGAFKPTGISQTKVKGGLKLQYLFNGKAHAYTFNTANGWFDKNFAEFLKLLSRDNGLPGNFYHLRYDLSVIYLTPQQHDYAVKHMLLN